MTEAETIRAAMRLLGMKTSEKKARSSRRNGKLAWSKKKKLTTSLKCANSANQGKIKKTIPVA